MSGKKFNLDSYKTDTTKTQDKYNKYSAFYENEANDTDENSESGKTNRKAQAVSKRINMAFSDTNYEFLISECERLSVSLVYLVNFLIGMTGDEDIEKYIGSMKICRSKDNIMRRKGNPAKRINLKFDGELHDRLNRGAKRYNMTITQYMNTIIEVHTQDKHNIGTR